MMTNNLAANIDRIIRIILLLLVAAVVLAVLAVMTTKRPEPVLLSASALSSQTLSLPASGDASGALVEAPLFWVSRRPYEASVDTAEEATQPSGPTVIDDMQLVGIVASGVETSAVIVNIRGQRRRISFGGEVEGWQLISMEPTEATFVGVARNGEVVERTLQLQDSRGQPRARIPAARANSGNSNNQD